MASIWSLLCSPRLHLFDPKYSKNSNIIAILNNSSFFIYFLTVIYFCNGKDEFSSAIILVFI